MKLDQVGLSNLEVLSADGQANSTQLLAALWSEWMGAAAANTSGAAMISSALTPYPHKHQAVYQRMLPQPMLRFLLGDEPGTGKTFIAGLYARLPGARSASEVSPKRDSGNRRVSKG